MNNKNVILVIVIILGSIVALGCTESDDNSETSVESETVQTGEAKAVQEEEPEPAITEETETVTETPVPEDTEESEVLSLEEAKEAEEEIPEEDDEEPEVNMETRMKQIEEEEAEEVEEAEESTSTISSDDGRWISVMLDDLADVKADMDDVSDAANNNDIAGLTIYTDRMYTSTQTAIDHCDQYDVSADLQPVEDEYRLAMVAYNWAALLCYDGIEAYNAGNIVDSTASFNEAAEFITSGTDHTSKATDLMNEYNENHGV